MNNIGCWNSDKAGLPCLEYMGDIPYSAKLKDGTRVKLPEDPWFLLGNYRFTLFTHISGEYELISGQRSWARINQGERSNSGVNSSVISIDGAEYSLTGMDSPAADSGRCERVFGCGFANYSYDINGIRVNRNLSVKPSTTPYNGASAFLLTVTVKNNSGKAAECSYTEFVGADFKVIQYQAFPSDQLPIKYRNFYSESKENGLASVKITAECDDPLLVSDRGSLSRHDGYPPILFIKSLSENTVFFGDGSGISAELHFVLEPSEERTLRIIIGYSFEYDYAKKKVM